MAPKLDNGPSKIANSNITQSFQPDHNHSKFITHQLPKTPLKIGSININEIKRKLNSLRIMTNKNKLDILFVQQIYISDKANMEKWLTANKFLIFLNHMIPKEQDPKYFKNRHSHTN